MCRGSTTGRLGEPLTYTWRQPGQCTRGGNNAMHMQCSQSRNKFLWDRRRPRIITSPMRYTQPTTAGCCAPADMHVWVPSAAMPPFCLAGIGNKFSMSTKGKSAGFNVDQILCKTEARPTAPSHITPHPCAGETTRYRHVLDSPTLNPHNISICLGFIANHHVQMGKRHGRSSCLHHRLASQVSEVRTLLSSARPGMPVG